MGLGVTYKIASSLALGNIAKNCFITECPVRKLQNPCWVIMVSAL